MVCYNRRGYFMARTKTSCVYCSSSVSLMFHAWKDTLNIIYHINDTRYEPCLKKNVPTYKQIQLPSKLRK